VLLFVGRLSPEKGIAELIERQGQISSAGLQLKIIGDGPLRAQVAARAKDAYVGPMGSEQVSQEMLAARALVMPSIWFEGQPRTALEAFAAGLPVAGSSLGALGELLAAQPAGWTFAPQGDWTSALANVSDDDEVATASASVRRLWNERFMPEQALASLLAIYEGATNRHHHHG
jgi:glycosyltransferase involved in cell wall biosynthesis